MTGTGKAPLDRRPPPDTSAERAGHYPEIERRRAERNTDPKEMALLRRKRRDGDAQRAKRFTDIERAGD